MERQELTDIILSSVIVAQNCRSNRTKAMGEAVEDACDYLKDLSSYYELNSALRESADCRSYLRSIQNYLVDLKDRNVEGMVSDPIIKPLSYGRYIFAAGSPLIAALPLNTMIGMFGVGFASLALALTFAVKTRKRKLQKMQNEFNEAVSLSLRERDALKEISIYELENTLADAKPQIMPYL